MIPGINCEAVRRALWKEDNWLPSRRLMLVILAAMSDSEGWVTGFSQADLGHLCKMDSRTVLRSLRDLESYGVVEWEKPRSNVKGENGKYRVTLWG